MRIRRRQEEVTKEELEKHVAEHPQGPLKFDGIRYTHPVEMRGGVWNKPVAAIVPQKKGEPPKHVLIHDV